MIKLYLKKKTTTKKYMNRKNTEHPINGIRHIFRNWTCGKYTYSKVHVLMPSSELL